jgi:putative transposase
MQMRRPTRLKGFAYVGIYRYSLRFSTYCRRHVFVAETPVSAALARIQRTCDEDQFAILAYCFMPDHLHLVLEGRREDADLRRLIKVAKQRCAYVFRRQFGIPLLWQEGCYERVLRSDEATDVVIRYVLNNPVRARLVENAENYPYAGALMWPQA